ncbi:MAG: hormogonium polysaccharide biosynthesis protein HpsA [Leptolyngbya sp. Prado105]|nr:hormogonium polysaccharide biosynthesis protein HpsA [Leptolyngbya sp. Prado105]
MLYQQRGKLSTAGFILPTTVLLVLVVALTVGALTFRAYNRNIQVIGDAQQRVIYNAATPAIDRARSKLEYLFDATKDTRLPSGVPSQTILEAMLLNNGKDRNGGDFGVLRIPDASGNSTIDPYTFPDETRIKRNNRDQNIWAFRTDTNGDGKLDKSDSTVVYSIILNTPPAVTTGTGSSQRTEGIATRLLKMKDAEKAADMYVRQAPLSVDGVLGCSVGDSTGAAAGPDGWFNDKTSTALLRKNFQVDALVIPGDSKAAKATLEFTQDRQVNRGNKWGAWFRHDLEIYPGPQFNWNGAMHTEGSLIIGGSSFDAFLISAPKSCLYYPDSSEITMTDMQGASNRNLLGLLAAGVVKTGNTGGSSSFHLHSDAPANTSNWATLGTGTDSSNAPNPFAITIDPETVLLEDGYTNVAPLPTDSKPNRSNRGAPYQDAAKRDLPDFGKNQRLPQRVYNNAQPAPYVDDLYRADDLWGPKPRYGTETRLAVPPGQYGKPIPSDKTFLTQTEPNAADKDAANVGLDGYWERRARAVGMRILVGQRLELGNLFTWYRPDDKNGDGYVGNIGGDPGKFVDFTDSSSNGYEHEGDPLYPETVKPYPVAPPSATEATAKQISHIDLQRRTMRDNLSAVQSTAVYHSAFDNKDYPVACLATTSHPGTLLSLRQSLIFEDFNFKGIDDTVNGSLKTNFFTGLGTNGWEFNTPGGDAAGFKTAIENTSSPLRRALDNLANFAGDYNPNRTVGGSPASGAFPPTINDNVIHPYPKLSMWGNFSELKRALSAVDTKKYDGLSVADKTYLQTAACTIGMLAYNIDEIQKFDPSNPANDPSVGSNRTLMARLAADLWRLMDGVSAPDNPEVLPRERLRTYNYSSTGSLDGTAYRLKDYQNVPPEAFIGALRAYLLTATSSGGIGLTPDNQRFMDEMRLAEMIMLHHQIRRDRTFGFKESPRFGEYAILTGTRDPDTSNEGFQSLPTACDPDQFTFTNSPPDLDFPRSLLDEPIDKPSTILNSGNLVSATNSDDFPTYSVGASRSILSQYRLTLSRLCGTLSADGNTVLPKFPSLYYLFPEVDHDHDGETSSTLGYDHVQPLKEPYIGDGASTPVQDAYIRSINPQFKRLSNTKALGREGYPSVLFTRPSVERISRIPDSQRVFPIEDYSVADVALKPRELNEWQLPYLSPSQVRPLNSSTNTRANFSTNLILIPRAGSPNELDRIAVPFLDRAFFDGRQLMMTRTLDIDLGMLRSTRVGSRNNTWLPLSGIVYAFREDAIREDAISRPACTTAGCRMNLTDPANPVDPPVKQSPTVSPGGISTKAIDEYPDPNRRIHGFRLRNGVQLMRNRSFEGVIVDAVDNNRGLSFFTDQPVYIQGDFNLHQNGADDTIGTRLEEFTTLLPDNRVYTASEFYGRTTRDSEFSKPQFDRWRPSEVLADSISILSNDFCDGTVSDIFVQFNGSAIRTSGFTNAYPVPDFSNLSTVSMMRSPSANREYYHQPDKGLFSPGCASANFTSFHNQNRPAVNLPAKVSGNRDTGWEWVRENSRYDGIAHLVDFASPVKISRSGQPLVVRPRETTGSTPDSSINLETQPPQNSPTGKKRDRVLPPVPYNIAFPAQPYFDYGQDSGAGANEGRRVLIRAGQSRVNSIVVSGITPSRPNQGYGGLHNFPRFIENWDDIGLNFAGSFIQLQYSNYATSPFEIENLDPLDANIRTDENIVYYQPPNRLWGYDVALQFSSASPAAARFANSSKNRSEYYVEPPANDAYISNLCEAAKAEFGLSTNCPKPQP